MPPQRGISALAHLLASPFMTPSSPSPASQPVLQAQGLRKSYGPRVALQSVSLALQAGEMVALLGPNGAGKSTLVQLLSGLFVPDQGSIQIQGYDMRTQAARALADLGVVFQQSALDADLSVQANLLFHTDLHGIPRGIARQRIDAGLAQHGLQAERLTPVHALSGGNRRKVELLRALLHRPAFLLMDEATVGLDPAARKALVDAVYALTREGKVAVLWATHLVEEVEQADRVIVLNKGVILFDGVPAALSERFGGISLEQAFLQLCAQTGPAAPA